MKTLHAINNPHDDLFAYLSTRFRGIHDWFVDEHGMIRYHMPDGPPDGYIYMAATSPTVQYAVQAWIDQGRPPRTRF